MSRFYRRVFLLAASPDKVYEVITQPEWLTKWFCNSVQEIDNGYYLEFDMPNSIMGIECRFKELIPHKHFSFEWESEYKGHDTQVDFDLYEENGGCRLVFTTSGFGDGPEWDAALRDESTGWNMVLKQLQELVGEGNSRSITYEEQIPASAANVLKAFTDPTQMAKIFGPGEPRIDLRRGGLIEYGTDPNGHQGVCYVQEYIPNQLLRQLWHWYEKELPETEVTISVEEQGASCQLKIVHSGFGVGSEWDRTYKEHTEGWKQIIEMIKSSL